MRILQITPRVPYPPDDGGKIGVFGITKYLAQRGHEITLLPITSSRNDHIPGLREYCKIETVTMNTANSYVDMLLNLFLGFAGGNNVGIKYVLAKNDFDYVWLLNNDTVIDKKALVEMVKLAETNKKIGIVGSKIMNYYSPNVIDVIGGGNFIPWMGIAREIGSGELDNGQWEKKTINMTYVKGASMLVRSDVIRNIGLMDESYFLYSEETDWCIRSSGSGWKLNCSMQSIVWHKEKGLSKDYKGNLSEFHKEYYIARNNLIILKKFYKKYLAIGFLLSFGIKFLVIVTKKEKRHDITLMKYAIKGYIDFLRGKAGRLT